MSDLDQVLDYRGGTLQDLLDLVNMKKVDRLVEAFQRCAIRAQPITAIEVMMAAHVLAGSVALEIIPDTDQRRRVCAAIAAHVVTDDDHLS